MKTSKWLLVAGIVCVTPLIAVAGRAVKDTYTGIGKQFTGAGFTQVPTTKGVQITTDNSGKVTLSDGSTAVAVYNKAGARITCKNNSYGSCSLTTTSTSTGAQTPSFGTTVK